MATETFTDNTIHIMNAKQAWEHGFSISDDRAYVLLCGKFCICLGQVSTQHWSADTIDDAAVPYSRRSMCFGEILVWLNRAKAALIALQEVNPDISYDQAFTAIGMERL